LRTIRVRLTLWYVLLLALTLAAFSAGVYFAMRESLYANLDESLEARAEIVAGIVATGGSVSNLPGDPVEGEEFIRTFDEVGRLASDNSAEEFRPPIDEGDVEAALSGQTSQREVSVSGLDLRVLTVPLLADGEIVGAAEVGLADGDVQETLNDLLLVIAVLYPVVLAVAGAGGIFLAGRALGPIDELTQTAQKITADGLGHRLATDGMPDDEVGRLARTFDEMIARLDASFRRQRQFTADASHELRTPLTALKGQAEVALQRERTVEEYREVLRHVNVETDRMIRLVGSLLTLARADAAQIPMAKESIDLRRTIDAALAQVRPEAERRSVLLRGPNTASLIVEADEGLILQLVLNLLDNAVKYTPAGGEVEVSCRLSAGWAEMTVTDSGPGIAPQHLERIFDRFYRADEARDRDHGGAGLGLSICRWIAEAHGGTIVAQSDPGKGSRFVVRFPSSS